MRSKKQSLSSATSDAEVTAFLHKAASIRTSSKASKNARLLFAMDATASREATWDKACQIQAEMFSQTTELGGLEIQLCYYRGFLEFETSAWFCDSHELLTHMGRVECVGGQTQIERVLEHAVTEKNGGGVDTVVFVGDCMEESVDRLCQLAGTLGLLGVPVFVFQEFDDPVAQRTFREIARLSKGIYCSFDANSPRQLRELLGAAAVYAAGGRRALESYTKHHGGVIRSLTNQLGGKN